MRKKQVSRVEDVCLIVKSSQVADKRVCVQEMRRIQRWVERNGSHVSMSSIWQLEGHLNTWEPFLSTHRWILRISRAQTLLSETWLDLTMRQTSSTLENCFFRIMSITQFVNVRFLHFDSNLTNRIPGCCHFCCLQNG